MPQALSQSSRGSGQGHGRSAFTLVELILVIAIVAVLASMLMPAIATVRGQARSMACQSNLRQVHLGIQAYAGEWNGTVMYGANQQYAGGALDAMAWGQNWGQTTAVLMQIPINYPIERRRVGVFNCPENLAQYQVMGTGIGEGETSYSGNCWNASRFTWEQEGRFFGARLAKLQNLDTLLAFWEGVYFRSESWQNNGQGTLPYMGIGMKNVRYAHRGAANLMIADGHAAKTRLLDWEGEVTGARGYADHYPNGRSYYGR